MPDAETVVDEGTGPSTAVVELVAAHEDVVPNELDVPLYDVIDTGALDRLLRSVEAEDGRTPPRVEFTYYDYQVTVTADGSVQLSDRHDSE